MDTKAMNAITAPLIIGAYPAPRPKPSEAFWCLTVRDQRVFTPAQIHKIRACSAHGDSLRTLSARFGVSRSAIHDIVRRRAYRDVLDIEREEAA